MTKKPKITYIQFYKVMLILSTIGTAISAASLLSLPKAIGDFPIAPAYHVILLLNYTVLLVSIVALVLLWKKQREGIILKIGTYIAYIILAVIALFTIEPYVQHLIATSINEAGPQAAGAENVITFIVKITSYSAHIFSVVIDIVFMLLWRSAWKKQVEEDS